MADISALGTLTPSEPLDLDTYADVKASNSFRLPKAGRYTLRAPESFPSTAFGKTKAGNLSIQIDPTIVGPTNEGFLIRFARISHKSYLRRGEQVSQIGDYLRACGARGRVSADPQEAADQVEATANLTYEANLDWRLYGKGHGEGGSDLVIEGMSNFPKGADGEPTPYVQSRTQKDDNGNPVVLRANIEIANGGFIPAS